MNILIINNGAIVQKDDGLYVEKAIGPFLNGLIKSNLTVKFFQFRIKQNDNDCMATFNLSETATKIVSVPWSENKIFSYVNAYTTGIKHVHKCDYLYIYYPNTFFLFAIFAIIFRKKYGLYVRGEQGTLSLKSKLLYKYASNIFTVSPVFTDKINSIGSNAITISPMIDFEIIDIVRNRKYDNKAVYNLLYLGRIEKDKGVFEIIDAVKLLENSSFRNFKLHVVGDGPDTANIRNLVREYNLQPYIEFHGSVYNNVILKKIYLSSDLIILPSYHEGFPRVIYEAMIMGTPILTSFVGTIPYLMKDKYNCYSLKIKNVNSIVDQIKFILSNYSETSKVAINATVTVSNYLLEHHESHQNLLSKALM